MLLTALLALLPQGPTIISKPDGKESTRVKVSYDKSADETTVSLPLWTVLEMPGTIEVRTPNGTTKLPSETLRMTAFFTYPGKTSVKPDHVRFGFLSLAARDPKYRDERKLSAKIDGRVIDLGEATVADRRIDTNMSGDELTFWRETLEAVVPVEKLALIAAAKSVTIRLGKTRFDLTPHHLRLLHALADKVNG